MAGVNFHEGCKKAFYLTLRHPGHFPSSSMIGGIMSVTGKAFIITLNSTFSILFINADFPNVQQPIVPTIVAVMISYCVSCLLLAVYDFGTHAILHCYLVDLDLG